MKLYETVEMAPQQEHLMNPAITNLGPAKDSWGRGGTRKDKV